MLREAARHGLRRRRLDRRSILREGRRAARGEVEPCLYGSLIGPEEVPAMPRLIAQEGPLHGAAECGARTTDRNWDALGRDALCMLQLVQANTMGTIRPVRVRSRQQERLCHVAAELCHVAAELCHVAAELCHVRILAFPDQ